MLSDGWLTRLIAFITNRIIGRIICWLFGHWMDNYFKGCLICGKDRK